MAKTYTVPSWVVQAVLAFVPTGKYNPGAFSSRGASKPSGRYNPGRYIPNPLALGPLQHGRMGQYVPGGYQERAVAKPTGEYNPGGFKERKVAKPSGKYNPGAYEDNDKLYDPDPYGNYHFIVELDGEPIGSFAEMSGLKTSTTVFEIEEGGYNHGTHKRAGQSKWENLVLRRMIDGTTKLAEWRDAYLRGDFNLRRGYSGAVVMYDNEGTEVWRFSFTNAWPVSWEGPTLNSGSSEIALETIEIAHDGPGGGEPDVTPPDPTPDPKPPEPGPIEFDFDDEHPQDPPGIDAAEAYGDQLADQEAREIWVEGHTDSMGSASYNKTLSRERAANTAAILRGKAPQHTYHEVGYGEDHPIAPNSNPDGSDNPAGRQRNRRCEIYYEPCPASGRPGWLY